jgi:hypothetical protein
MTGLAHFEIGRCWQGYCFDPDANTFGIFEVDPGAGVAGAAA